MTEETRLHKPSGFFWARLPTNNSYMYFCIVIYFGSIKLNWTEIVKRFSKLSGVSLQKIAAEEPLCYVTLC